MRDFVTCYFKILLFFTVIYLLTGLYILYKKEKSFEAEIKRKITALEDGSKNIVVVSPIGVQAIPLKGRNR